MGFDTMRSYQHLKLTTLASTITTLPECWIHENTHLCARQRSSGEGLDEARRRGGVWDDVVSDLDILPPTRSISKPDCPPAFHITKAGWSPPPSPRSHSRPEYALSCDSAVRLIESPPSSPRLTLREINDVSKALYDASCSGDISLIQALLKAGAPIDSATPVPALFDNFTPAKTGHLSPLAGAASHGQLDAVEILVAVGARVNPSASQSASSPLHQACRHNDLEIAQFLLEHGADVNLGDCYNQTPLMHAVKYGSLELVSLILAAKPDLTRRTFIGYAAIHCSILPNRPAVTEMLLRAGADVNHRGPEERTPLHLATCCGSVDMARLLLVYGANPMQRDVHHSTPLDLAEENNAVEIRKLVRESETLTDL